jgi:hypothetical protein
MLKCKTSREYFEKYCHMRKMTGVSFLNTTIFGTKEELTKLFLEDPNLNQIPHSRMDCYHPRYRELWPGLSLAECTCLIKHSLVYQVIGAVPEFTD